MPLSVTVPHTLPLDEQVLLVCLLWPTRTPDFDSISS